MGLTKIEMETVITFNETDEPATIYTNSVAWKNRLAKLVVQRPAVCVLEDIDGFGGETYRLPKQWLKLFPPLGRSDAQKMASLAALAKARQKKDSLLVPSNT